MEISRVDKAESRFVLNTDQFKKLLQLIPMLEQEYEDCLAGESLQERYLVGKNVYISLDSECLCMDVRMFYCPRDSNDIRPTKRGVSFNLAEVKQLRRVLQAINLEIPPEPFYNLIDD